MKKAIKITIPKPCHEDWNVMTPQAQGRHCASCKKTVVDFTQRSDEELLQRVSNDKHLCGRFKPEQLDRELTLSRKRKNPLLDYAATLLIPAAIFSTRHLEAIPNNQEPLTYTSLHISSLDRGAPKESVTATTSVSGTMTIKGTVTDASGPLSGAIITVKGTDRSVRANENGTYAIDVARGEVLVYSYLGYGIQEITITKCKKYNIVLKGHMIMGEIAIMGRVAIHKN